MNKGVSPTCISDRITLPNGQTIPQLGIGTFRMPKGVAYRSVLHALKRGYRLIDTAQFYMNEDEVGEAVKDSGVKREDIYISTKLWNSKHGYQNCIDSFKESLKKLQMDYVDMYLMHNHMGGDIEETFRAMVDIQTQGLAKAVGVSNYGIIHLEALRQAGLPPPVVNQVEVNCFWRQEDLLRYCTEHGIHLMGYAPVGRMDNRDHPTLRTLAQKYGKSVAQIMLRWSLQMGYVSIPSADTPEWVEEDADLFDWSLEEEDMKTLSSLPAYRSCFLKDPCTAPLGLPWPVKGYTRDPDPFTAEDSDK